MIKKNITFFLFLSILFFSFWPVKNIKANIFPDDAITVPFNNNGLGQITIIATGTKTILQATMISYADSVSQGSYIDCGATRIAKAFNKSWVDSRLMVYECDNSITTGNSGTTGSYGQVVYIPYHFSTTTATTSINTNMNIENLDFVSTSSDGVITYGQINSPLILFVFIYLIIILIFFAIFLFLRFKELY